MGALRFEVQGIVGGVPAIVVEHVTRIDDTLAPEWPQGNGSYRVLVKGDPGMRCDYEFWDERGDHAVGGVVLTATRIVNAIPAVCDAKPDLLSALDLPLVTGGGCTVRRDGPDLFVRAAVGSVRGEAASSPLRSPASAPDGGEREAHVLRAQGAPTTRLSAQRRNADRTTPDGRTVPPPRRTPMGVHATTAADRQRRGGEDITIARPTATCRREPGIGLGPVKSSPPHRLCDGAVGSATKRRAAAARASDAHLHGARRRGLHWLEADPRVRVGMLTVGLAIRDVLAAAPPTTAAVARGTPSSRARRWVRHARQACIDPVPRRCAERWRRRSALSPQDVALARSPREARVAGERSGDDAPLRAPTRRPRVAVRRRPTCP
jgi:hypothetical protein